MNLSLIIQKLHDLGILGTPIPVHLGPISVQVALCWPVPVQVRSVPVQVGLWWAVPVQPGTCTGTPSRICPDLLFLPTFGTKTLHTTSPFLNTSKIIMEIIQKQLHNTLIGDLEPHTTKP